MKNLRFVVLALVMGLMVTPVYAQHVGSPQQQKTLLPDSNPGMKYLDDYSSPGQPYTEVLRVRYGRQGANWGAIPSGCAVSWDANSHDGVTVSMSTGTWNAGIAGIAVTELLTQDSSSLTTSNWGYIAVRGYCLASVDTSEAYQQMPLVRSNAVDGLLATTDNFAAGPAGTSSNDIGVLLQDTGTDGPMPVWLHGL